MDYLDLVTLSSMLFTAGFFAEIAGLRRGAEKQVISPATSYLYPACLIWIVSQTALQYTDYTVLKLALLLHCAIQSAHQIVTSSERTLPLHLFDLLLAAVMYWIATMLYLPLSVINTAMFAVVGLFAVLHFVRMQRTGERERFELAVIALLSAVLLIASTKLLTLFSGAVVLLIYQAWDLYRIARFQQRTREELVQRLYELEHRFDRQVDFEARRRTTRMSTQVEEIRESAQKDPLTKALNRAGINSEIHGLINDPTTKIFSIALLDLDHFKEINDKLGHMVGDESLKFLASYIMRKKRRTDLLGRFGGDEFVLVFPNLNAPEALKTMNRIRREIEQFSEPKYTISVGVATYPFDGKSISELMNIADQALYYSKENGKNRVSYLGHVPILDEANEP